MVTQDDCLARPEGKRVDSGAWAGTLSSSHGLPAHRPELQTGLLRKSLWSAGALAEA